MVTSSNNPERNVEIKKILELPEYLKRKVVTCVEHGHGECTCPFFDDGDGGYGSHCNLLKPNQGDLAIPEVQEIERKMDKIKQDCIEKGFNSKEFAKLTKDLRERLKDISSNHVKYCPLKDAIFPLGDNVKYI